MKRTEKWSAGKIEVLWIPWYVSFRYIDSISEFTPKMKANAFGRLLWSLVWIDSGVVVLQHHLEYYLHELKCNGMTIHKEFIVWWLEKVVPMWYVGKPWSLAVILLEKNWNKLYIYIVKEIVHVYAWKQGCGTECIGAERYNFAEGVIRSWRHRLEYIARRVWCRGRLQISLD